MGDKDKVTRQQSVLEVRKVSNVGKRLRMDYCAFRQRNQRLSEAHQTEKRPHRYLVSESDITLPLSSL